MSGQKYKRTNFDDEDNTSTGGTPPGVTYDPAVAFKAGATFWQRRTCLERVLLFLSIALLLAAVVLGALLATKTTQVQVLKQAEHKQKELCTTSVCVTVASSILQSLDTSIDPCDDFYQYACGNWIKTHPILPGHSKWGTFGSVWMQNQLVLKNVLERPLNETASTAEQKAKKYYQSCLDTTKIVEKRGAKPLLDLIREHGGWSISSKSGGWSPDNWNFSKTLYNMHAQGLPVLFSLWVSADEKNSTQNIMQFDQSGLTLPSRDQYLNKSIDDDKVLSAYLTYMVDIGVLLGGEENDTRDQMREVIEFEQQLANITIPEENRRDDEKLYHKWTLAKLSKKSPLINWESFVNYILSVTDYRVNSSEKVVVIAPEYLAPLSAMVHDMLNTSDGIRIMNNYMKWHLAKDFAPYLSEPFKTAGKKFSKVLSGVTGQEEKWRECTSDTDGSVGYALGAMFVRETFHGDSKKQAEAMIKTIKESFKNNLPNLKWMDAQTRRAAIEKADAVIDMIGFPEFILNATALDKRYENLHINESEYFENNIREGTYSWKRILDKLRKPPDKFSWGMTPPTVNAYYTPTRNEIVFPAGILQAPYYNKGYPKSLNYGGMGVVMGHELTHGFDDEGREYDKVGNLRSWWNEASVEKFKKQAQCMEWQYSNYTVNGEHIRGKQTLGENIADNGGLKASFNAYEKWVEKHGEERPLPGIDLTHRQLFFLAFAQVWCSSSKPEAVHMGLIRDPHSPEKYRVIGSVSNSYEFAKQYACKRGSPMNPVKKCEVW